MYYIGSIAFLQVRLEYCEKAVQAFNMLTANYEITHRLRSLLGCQLQVISYSLNLN